MNTGLDHIVIGAATLEQGVKYIKDYLGVDIPPGGEHFHMGTHNHLMQLGNELFLEVMAINPKAVAPKRPRWFGLDDPFVKAQLESQPRLLTWVVNTPNINSLQQQSRFNFGAIASMSRGDIEWLITVPDDGSLPGAGMLPTLIEWRNDTHPSNRYPDLGCFLQSLEIYHPNVDWLKFILQSVGADQCVELFSLPASVTPYMVAHIQTPSGVKQLSSKVFA
ncbi:MAG: VOC family protein [Mastigocoleus sp. MO_167.B18]|nr:VOC family protein [Mastigocoleus sp. MO_167.B18]